MPQFSVFKKYRILPLVGLGAVTWALLTLLALLIWTFIAFKGNFDLAEHSAAPTVIYLGAVLLSCGLMTALIRGGTVFPSAVLGLLAAAAALLLAPGPLQFGPLLGKLLLTLLTAIIGFVAVKLFFVLRRPRRPQPAQAPPSQRLESWQEEAVSINEPGK